jgi:predicted AlkP superfamily phosphohydrolase/phosphomutase
LAGSNQIWINLGGRQPQGSVSPGEEYEAVVALIQGALQGAVDPSSGRRVIERVYRRSDLYTGPFLDQAPDLLVKWAESPVWSGLAWDGDAHHVIATRRTAHRRHPVNGSHREMGILVAHGPQFKSGVTIDGATLYDIAPTLLYLLVQSVPAGLDGQVLTSALTENWLRSHPPQLCGQDRGSSPSPPVTVSAEEEEEVMGRLRSLGYVE